MKLVAKKYVLIRSQRTIAQKINNQLKKSLKPERNPEKKMENRSVENSVDTLEKITPTNTY